MRRRGTRRALGPLALAGVVTATLAAATLVSKEFFERPRPPTPDRPARPDARVAERLRVAVVEGSAEALHDGQWYVLQAGDTVELQDVIRTPRGARVVLRWGAVEIEVPEGMDVRVEEIAARAATFGLLRGGRVMANVEGRDQKVAFTANDARAENLGPARFVFSATSGGAASVASTRGDVRFSARGGEVTVRGGSESTALPGGQPGEPEPIPEELLLSVIWPELPPGEREAAVTGTARPSSRVFVNGVETPVGPDGSFAVAIPLQVGPNRVQVDAEDIAGRKKTVEKVLRRPPPVPRLHQADEELWKK